MREYSEEDLKRYSRQIILKEIGVEGQNALLQAKVLLIGAGGLGSPAALYLAAAGIGTLGLADHDQVDLTNLQRQIVHFTSDLGRPKVESAAEKLADLNPDCRVLAHQIKVEPGNIRDLVHGYDFVIDGTDNFNTKFLINDTCVEMGIPFCHGGILRFTGQAMTILPGQSACYRCLFPDPPQNIPTCAEAGVIGSVAGILGAIQATEAIKFFTQPDKLLTGRLLALDILNWEFRKIKVSRLPDCPSCGGKG